MRLSPCDAVAKCNQMKMSTAYENIFDLITLSATVQLSTGEKELGLYCAIKTKDEREHCVEMNVATRRNKHLTEHKQFQCCLAEVVCCSLFSETALYSHINLGSFSIIARMCYAVNKAHSEMK